MESKDISAFWLKIMAITGMTLQHAALALRGMFSLPVEIFLQISGGLTFPILAFLLVEGFRATSDLKKYKKRILIFAIISIVPHMIALGSGANIMFTLLFGLIILELRAQYGKTFVFWILFTLLALASLFFDWGIIGVVVILLYDIIKCEKKRRIIGPIVAAVGAVIISVLLGAALSPLLTEEALATMNETTTIAGAFFPIGSLLAIPLLLMYKGNRGPRMKWFFYVFYPAHLAILAVLSLVFDTNVLVNMVRDVLSYIT